MHQTLLYLLLLAALAMARSRVRMPNSVTTLTTTPKPLPIYKGCGHTITNVPEGIIDYPGDGGKYARKDKCVWRITILKDEVMDVSIERFNTHSKDKLLIKNGENGATIGSYYKTSAPPTFETEGNQLYLYFLSKKGGYPGFRLTWKTRFQPVDQCEGTEVENSILWDKVESSTTAIKETVHQGNINVTNAMEIRMHKLEDELQSMKKNHDKVMNDLTEANSKLDYIMEHLGSCEKPPKPSTSKPSMPPTPSMQTLSPQICTCGIPNKPVRIIGGQDVEPYKYPWHVGLYSYTTWYDYFCGGSIINNLYVLTAAHCVYPTFPSNLLIGIGDHNQSSDADDLMGLTQFIEVESVYAHHLYDDNSLDYDFALIRLSEPIEFTDVFGIRPVCLPDNDANTYESEMALVLGWGATNYSSYWGGIDFPDILQEVEVQVLDPSCNYVYENITDAMLCAASPGKDSCSGDSGGSLSVSNNGQYTQIGISSWGSGCAIEYYPGVYSRVTSVIDWIKGLSSDGVWCSASNSSPPPPPPPTPSPPPPPTPSPTKPSSKICSCGVPNYPNRIINGRPVEPQKYPWHVGLYSKSIWSKYFCGGTVINSVFVLTAAHCVYPHPPHDLFVVIGDHKQTMTTDDESFTQKIKVENTIRHKSYNDHTVDYDFALLRLSSTIEFNDEFGIRPICLPENELNAYEDEMGTILGWGEDEKQQYPITLHEVDVQILDSSCRNAYTGQITSRMLCAASPGKDACSGDSGGSIAVMENGQYVQVGITSWGQGCAQRKYPGVYSRVTAVLPWIRENANDGDWCME